jgi:LmbE family N-acetylglucosaminyl deacetylase
MESQIIPYTSVRSVGRGVVLVLAPHSDDEVFGCGGAIMRHVADGDPVHVVIVTDGGWQAEANANSEYTHLRRSESLCAAKILGYGTPEFWCLEDRNLNYSESLVQRIGKTIQELGANMIYAPSIYEMHPDHRALALAAVSAARDSGVTLVMYEVGVPLPPNLLLDITDLQARKSEAMSCFHSQLEQRDYAGHIEALNRFRAYTLSSTVKAAESYLLINSDALPMDPLDLYDIEAERQRRFGSSLANSASYFGGARWRTAWRKISCHLRTSLYGPTSSK